MSTSSLAFTAEPQATETPMPGYQPCTCAGCGTDEYLVPEAVRTCRLPGHRDTTGWDVSYWCSRCDRYAGHITDALPPAWSPDSIPVQAAR